MTYQTEPTDFSVGSVSGPQEARYRKLERARQAVLPDSTLTDMAMRFWLWMSGYIVQCLSAQTASDSSRGQHIVFWPRHDGALGSDNPAAPDSQIRSDVCALRLNRSLARRLRRLARRGPQEDEFNLLSFQQSSNTEHLSPAQYLEWMIRVYRCGRTKLYGLNATRRDLRRRAVECLGLQGALLVFRNAGLGAAPLSPD